MPKYVNDVIAGYVLYFTSKCIVEAMHVHASDKNMNSRDAAKIFVHENGDTTVEKQGIVSEKDMLIIRKYIKNNHEEMYKKWVAYGGKGYKKKCPE